MEMDSIEGNHHGDSNEDESAEHSFSPEAVDVSGIYGDPEILPRVGDEYQVEIPPLIVVSDYLRLLKNLSDAEIAAGGSCGLIMGLPIPVMWIDEGVKNKKHDPDVAFDNAVVSNKIESIKSDHVRATLIASVSDNMKCKAEPMDCKPDHGNDRGRMYPVPGSVGDNWIDIEEAGFLLGLYIFGKNFNLVKKFVGSKQRGDILSFYYGKFYRSKRYRRWSECQKMRSRKCIFGQRIFTGLRQQELLSRLLPHVSEECKNTLLEVSKTFGEGKMLLEEYVFILKARVGLNALVEAVGIGKGKRDLTGISMEPLKSNQVVPVRPEIPIGKACSTLTPLEIVNFLTGDIRLSKARSSDLFWEAVWPRLLARGWHSEQNQGFATGPKNSLVFLIPGIKKFSRRKLVKGNHYFDSVTDVLSKVASDPGLLELEMGADTGSRNKNENGWTGERKMDEEDFPNLQRPCYLKPRTPIRSTDVMKFTVVDTSLSNGKTSKVRELRSLPIELKAYISCSDSEDDDGDASEESTDKSNSADNLCSHRDEVKISNAIKIHLGKKDDQYIEYDTSPWEVQAGTSKWELQADTSKWEHQADTSKWKLQADTSKLELQANTSKWVHQANTSMWELQADTSKWDHQAFGRGSTTVTANIPKGESIGICNDMRRRKAMKCQRSQKMVPEDKDPFPPVSKRRRLSACNGIETTNSNHILRGGILQQDVCSSGDHPELSEKARSQVDFSEEKLSSTSTSSRGGSPVNSGEGILGRNNLCVEGEQPHENPRPRVLIDLNIPISSDAESDEPFTTVEREDDQASQELDAPHSVNSFECGGTSKQEPTINSRRQSTRNRPLTTKALEALASGYLDTKQTRKRRDPFPEDNSRLKTSRRARTRKRAPDSFDTSLADFNMQETTSAMHNSNADGFSELEMIS